MSILWTLPCVLACGAPLSTWSSVSVDVRAAERDGLDVVVVDFIRSAGEGCPSLGFIEATVNGQTMNVSSGGTRVTLCGEVCTSPKALLDVEPAVGGDVDIVLRDLATDGRVRIASALGERVVTTDAALDAIPVGSTVRFRVEPFTGGEVRGVVDGGTRFGGDVTFALRDGGADVDWTIPDTFSGEHTLVVEGFDAVPLEICEGFVECLVDPRFFSKTFAAVFVD